MAKKENEYAYGSAYLPDGEKKYSVIRWGWNGLNETDNIDTGQISASSGIVIDPPYVMPVKDAKMWFDPPGDAISIHGFDDWLLVISRQDDKIVAWGCYKAGDATGMISHVIADAQGDDSDFQPRSVVQFNVVDTSSGDIASYTYDRRWLIFPDCYSIRYQDDEPGGGSSFNPPENPIPGILYASVYQSRVFGVDKNSVYASHYNSYADFTLDTADNISPDNAWMSMSQSNTKADGDFTAIATYDNHVVLFKKDFMQLVYNNKNPFRIVDVGAYGCDNSLAVTEMGGVLYFASKDKIYAYTGGTPKDISKNLDIDSYAGAALGSFKDTLWLSVNGELYTYKNGVWSDLGVSHVGSGVCVKQFATLDYALVGLLSNGRIVYLDWDEDVAEETTGADFTPTYNGLWWFATDIMALGRLDIRRVKKMSVLCEGEKDAVLEVLLLPDVDIGHDWVNPIFDPVIDSKNFVGSVIFDKDGTKMLRVLTRQFSGTRHQLIFAGVGNIKIHAAELKIAWGGDLYVEE